MQAQFKGILLRHFKSYIKRSSHLSRIAAVPLLIGIGVSGCVSTDASLTSQLAPTTITVQPTDPSGLGVQEEVAYNGSIPTPSQANLTSAYNNQPIPDTQSNLAELTAGTPKINALNKAGQIYVAQTPVTTNQPEEKLLLTSAEPVNTTSTSLARQGGEKSFFNQLFKRQPVAGQPSGVTNQTQSVAAPKAAPKARVKLAQKPIAKKEQITEAKSVALASATPLPGVDTKKRNVFSAIFGSKSKKDSSKRVEVASLVGLARLSPLTLQRQTERVDVACLKPELVRLLKKVERHYGKPVVVTSGYRSPKHNKRIGGANGSRHTTCEAADVQVKGVSKWELAKHVRSMSDRGGVGTYCHTQSVHIDTGSVRDWNWRCRKRKK